MEEAGHFERHGASEKNDVLLAKNSKPKITDVRQGNHMIVVAQENSKQRVPQIR